MDANVEQTAYRQLNDPAEVEVEHVHSVEEALVHVRVGDVRNSGELDRKTKRFEKTNGQVLRCSRLLKGFLRQRYRRRLCIVSSNYVVVSCLAIML